MYNCTRDNIIVVVSYLFFVEIAVGSFQFDRIASGKTIVDDFEVYTVLIYRI